MIPKIAILAVLSGSLGTVGSTLIDFHLTHLVFSLLIAVVLFLFAKIIIQTKLGDLKGSSKLLGLISVGIAAGEIFYIGIKFEIFNLAIEFIAYLGIGLWIILIPFQTYLKNTASGISNYMNTDIDIGDIVEIKGKRGVITEFHLTKTILLSESGEKITIPNHRFHEDIIVISPKKSDASKKFNNIKKKPLQNLFKN